MTGTDRRANRRRSMVVSGAVLCLAVALALTVASAAFAAPPTIKSIKPTQGPNAGGNKVTIKGANFSGASTVKFGSVAAASFVVKSASTVSAIAPPGIGIVSVTVTTPEGTTPAGPSDEYEYVAVGPPAVSSVSPDRAPVKGGKRVHIKGTNFLGTSAVDFGATPATSFEVVSENLIIATNPRGVAIVDVTVTTPEGESAITPGDKFEYTEKGPQVIRIGPSEGAAAGGTEVEIRAEHVLAVSAVHFSEFNAPFTVLSEGSEGVIVATSPASTVGILHIHVTTFYGTSGDVYCHKGQPCRQTGYFRVVEPTVTGVSPNHGPVAGGTPVTVTGTGFAVGSTRTTIQVDKVPATGVECSSITTCTFITPPGKAGARFVKVKVESDDPEEQGTHDGPASVFTYE